MVLKSRATHVLQWFLQKLCSFLFIYLFFISSFEILKFYIPYSFSEVKFFLSGSYIKNLQVRVMEKGFLILKKKEINKKNLSSDRSLQMTS